MKHAPTVAVDPQVELDDKIICQALRILDQRMQRCDVSLGSPGAVRDYLRLHLGQQEHETFTVLFINVKNRLIHKQDMFHGTLTHTSVYPREVVKAALRHNAASVMFAHNHPSGECEPSESDRLLTTHLKRALELVDVRVLDHFVVAQDREVYSFAEHGEI